MVRYLNGIWHAGRAIIEWPKHESTQECFLQLIAISSARRGKVKRKNTWAARDKGFDLHFFFLLKGLVFRALLNYTIRCAWPVGAAMGWKQLSSKDRAFQRIEWPTLINWMKLNEKRNKRWTKAAKDDNLRATRKRIPQGSVSRPGDGLLKNFVRITNGKRDCHATGDSGNTPDISRPTRSVLTLVGLVFFFCVVVLTCPFQRAGQFSFFFFEKCARTTKRLTDQAVAIAGALSLSSSACHPNRLSVFGNGQTTWDTPAKTSRQQLTTKKTFSFFFFVFLKEETLCWLAILAVVKTPNVT